MQFDMAMAMTTVNAVTMTIIHFESGLPRSQIHTIGDSFVWFTQKATTVIDIVDSVFI